MHLLCEETWYVCVPLWQGRTALLDCLDVINNQSSNQNHL